MKKHLFPFQGGVEFLGVNGPLLFEWRGRGACGFLFWVTFALCRKFVIFKLLNGDEGMVFFHFFCSFLKGEGGHQLFFHFFLLLNWGSGREFCFFIFCYFFLILEGGRGA